jgi:hypothetical protein
MLDDHFEGIPVLVYDLSVPIENRVPKEFPTLTSASHYLGVTPKVILNATDPLKKRKIQSPKFKQQFAVRLKKSK